MLDFGGNVLRHGPVDQLRIEQIGRGEGNSPAKECPACNSMIAAGYAACPECGYKFPPPERRQHDAKASEAGILSGQVITTKYSVEDMFFNVHTKRDLGDWLKASIAQHGNAEFSVKIARNSLRGRRIRQKWQLRQRR